jgi:hypothetical protein
MLNKLVFKLLYCKKLSTFCRFYVAVDAKL